MGTDEIHVTANFFAGLGSSIENYDIKEGVKVTLPRGATIMKLLESFSLSYKKIALVVLNGKRTSVNTKLNEGDQVDIFPPVGGG